MSDYMEQIQRDIKRGRWMLGAAFVVMILGTVAFAMLVDRASDNATNKCIQNKGKLTRILGVPLICEEPFR